MKPVLFLQNITLEGPGTIGSFLETRNIPIVIRDLYKGHHIPDKITEFGAVIVLGGPMNVDEEDKYPFLKLEKEFLRECVHKRVPVLGTCLGGQLLAAALGAKVKKNKCPEIGWMNVEMTPAGKNNILFSGLVSPLPVFQWHGDTFNLPDGSVHLAHSKHCLNQAFSIDDMFFGIQFHLEVTNKMAREWAHAYYPDTKLEDRKAVEKLMCSSDIQFSEKIEENSALFCKNFFYYVAKYR